MRFQILAPLPTRLHYARNFTGERQLAEANSAQVKLAQIAPRAAATVAAVAMPAFELRLLIILRDFCGSCHSVIPFFSLPFAT
jgi:hypothetical protein